MNTVTVGNYRDSTMAINTSSNYRDSLDTNSTKPELSAPGTSIAAGTDASGNPLPASSGNSLSVPIVSGVLADLMQVEQPLRIRPHLSKAVLLAGSTDAISGGADAVGVGGLDALVAEAADYRWWDGANSSFTAFAANDGGTSANAIESWHSYSASRAARFCIAWMTAGSYTYAHRTDAFPLAADFDLVVSAPNGQTWSSASSHNPYECVSFTTPVAGTYKVTITRFFNRDTSADTRLALANRL